MSTSKKTFILVSFLIIAILSAGYFYTNASKHRVIEEEEATATFHSSKLRSNFMNQASAPYEFIDQVIEVKGVVTSSENNSVVLDGMVVIDFSQNTKTKAEIGQIITIKGRCVGYDELLEVVRIDQAIQITN